MSNREENNSNFVRWCTSKSMQPTHRAAQAWQAACELFVQSNGMTLLVYSDEVSTTVKETPEQIMSWIITGKLE